MSVDELTASLLQNSVGEAASGGQPVIPSNIDVLFQPVSYGALAARNRFVYAPLTRERGFVPSEVNVEYYRQRATESGRLITEGTLPELLGTEWSHVPGIWSKQQVAGWRKVAEAVHAEGGTIVMQLWHLGRVVHPLLQGGKPNVGPSAITARYNTRFRQLQGAPGYVQPLTIEDP